MKKTVKKSEETPAEGICPVDYAFQRIGGKHKGRAIWHLRDGLLRYGQLKKQLTGITPKMLTQILRELEEDGLIDRQVYLEVPPRVEYRLTTQGTELLPFIELLRQWSEKQLSTHQLSIANY